MKKLITAFWLAVSLGTFAQVEVQNQALSTLGNSFTDGITVIDFTLGETFTSALTTSNQLITQGFEQPVRKKYIIIDPVVGIEELENTAFLVYPNPFNQEVTIEVSSLSELHVQIYDNSGRIIKNEKLNTLVTTLDLSELAVGNYQIVLTDQKAFIGRIPVVKTL